ncbi:MULTISPECIES: alpha-hydroxy acid oxidase [Streptomyces]|uniref:Alpha-hydroxy acid oxidase n=1 Tax=Streptomyces eurythermus TaxID=42237 RepID=A0ABW6YYT9_9ACTN|nr:MULTISPECIES: alpha-hydroxy acid oxidase [Streptomyces]WDM10472.1 alpha-hydroxy-acid oxidizing protein [Streptomyces lavenduligriseus]
MTDVVEAGQPRPPHSVADFADAARAVIPPGAWDFVSGGSGAELSMAANRRAFDNLYVAPRMLRDVSHVSTATRLVGTETSLPVAIAPMAYHGLVHPHSEAATARAAKTAGVPFTAAMLSGTPVERIAESGADLWFQLYWLRDRGATAELVSRAEAAGCQALMLTVDVPRLGRRLKDHRNGFALPPDVYAAHFRGEAATGAQRGSGAGSAVATHTTEMFDPSLAWGDIEWLRARTRLPLVVKGILTREDAVRAVRSGVDALVVSNHGGRQLDGAVPALTVLPEIRDAVGDTVELLVDGGIRSGTDVLKALARGADGVLLGRPVLYGLAVGGESGVEAVLSLLREELETDLALSGCRTVGEAAHLKTYESNASSSTGTASW